MNIKGNCRKGNQAIFTVWPWGSDKAQWVEALATWPDSVSLVLRTHTVGGEKQLLRLTSGLHICTMAHDHITPPPPRKMNKCKNKNKRGKSKCGQACHLVDTIWKCSSVI